VASRTEKLFKYCSIETAKQIITGLSLRWSAPIVFADPLELNHTTHFNLETESLLQATIKLAASMVFASSTPNGDTPLINAIRRWREDERFAAPEEAEGVLRELLSKMVDQRMLVIEEFHRQWMDYNRKIRICSFSSRPDNMTAWDLFADGHRGVCLRFDCTEQSSTRQPRQVEYSNNRPELIKLRDQVDAILFNIPQNQNFVFESLFSLKAPHRKQEQEWRCFRKTSHSDTGENPMNWVDDVPFDPTELSAACFGIETSEADKKSIIALMKEHLGVARSYQTNLAAGKYELEVQKA